LLNSKLILIIFYETENFNQFEESEFAFGESYRDDGEGRLLHRHHATESGGHRLAEISASDADGKSSAYLFQECDGFQERKDERKNGGRNFNSEPIGE
jgi:hypothetical protein